MELPSTRKERKDLISGYSNYLFTLKSKEWTRLQKKYEERAFKNAYKNVSAYKTFVDSSKAHNNVKKIAFTELPSVTKKNYLRAFPWETLCSKALFKTSSQVMTSTSGSTGVPFYFPRTESTDIRSAIYHELFLITSSIKKNKTVLVVDCFGMGVWIGGIITYQAFKHIGEEGRPLTIITPGINKKEIFQALRTIAKQYDYVILAGYPPFIKDVIDEGASQGVFWNTFSLKIIFAAESFSETFRDYIVEKTGIKDLYRDTMNIYGSADLGTMAEETPLSILLRRLALTRPGLYKKLFTREISRLPTLAQYVPEFVSFEECKGTILCTGDTALPLIRYDIGDNGGVHTYQAVVDLCNEEGVDLLLEAKKVMIENTITELPFVFVYERSDFSASFYGALIYPEYIKHALGNPALHAFLTGKFSLSTNNDEEENQYLEINIEVKKGVSLKKKEKESILKEICNSLSLLSAEYKKITESIGARAEPKLIFWEYGHEKHFLPGAKQKWVTR